MAEIAMITAYDAQTTEIADESGIPSILVVILLAW
jgi:ketopantoate hydroxymethyltransferase